MEELIEKYLNDLINNELNSLPGTIEPEMLANKQNKDTEWNVWLPIKSTVLDKEIKEFEGRLGFDLPKSFIKFLKYKHFYELFIGECEFCAHPINIWRDSLTEIIFNGYPRELLFDKGKIPFANWSDWGLLCFDTTTKSRDDEYPIVLWDHDLSQIFKPMYSNFESMLIELDKNEKEE